MNLIAVFVTLHAHAYTLMKDENGHWDECACGDKINAEKHIPGDAATEEKPQICTVCGYELAPVLTPTPAPDTDVLPKTGDDSRMMIWLALFGAAAASLIVLRKKAYR